jgi:1,4-dihydroxy-2-naphthoyl-CoA hydrolase
MSDQEGEGPAHLGEHLSLVWDDVVSGRAAAHFVVTRAHMAPNQYLHAASVIGLADSACGFGCMASRPEGATSFTTIELKSNFLASARIGETVACEARLVHGGRTTQVWDAEVVNRTSGRTIALFRCTQMLIYPR